MKTAHIDHHHTTFDWTIGDRDLSYSNRNNNYKVACGGTEVPFRFHGSHYLYTYNIQDRQNYYYCFELDIYIDDKQMNQMMDAAILRV